MHRITKLRLRSVARKIPIVGRIPSKIRLGRLDRISMSQLGQRLKLVEESIDNFKCSKHRMNLMQQKLYLRELLKNCALAIKSIKALEKQIAKSVKLKNGSLKQLRENMENSRKIILADVRAVEEAIKIK